MREIPVDEPEQTPTGLHTRTQLASSGLRPCDPQTPQTPLRQHDAAARPDSAQPLWSVQHCAALPPAPSRRQRRRDRAQAAAWARSVTADPTAVVLDTETTSLHDAQIVEIAAVTRDGTELVNELLNPATAIHADASAVHGLFDEDVGHRPDLVQLATRLESLLGERRIIAWNAGFDQQALANSYRAWGLDTPGWVQRDWHDAMRWHAAYHGEWDADRGRYRCHRLDGGHRAAGDCAAVWPRITAMGETVEFG